MRNWIAVVAFSALFAHGQAPFPPPIFVDLDKPGELEQLKAERPEHYAKVMEQLESIQTAPRGDFRQHNLRFSPDSADLTMRRVETSDPAKARVTVAVERVLYNITLHYIKDPATMSPAK